MSEPQSQSGIAIIGMAGRFPKASDLDAFWNNVCAGRNCISFFDSESMERAGIEFPRRNRDLVQARGVLEDADKFDAAFFGYSPREAEIMDPQHRIFLECAWEALEDAGCDPDREERPIGVFASASMNTYLITHLLSRPDLLDVVNAYQLMLGGDKDFLPTRVSYKLNLRGPSLNVQTACSTALVSVCVACQNLLTLQCDIALAGSVSVTFPQRHNHLFQDGGIASPDGHCRAFDANAQGTVPGEGAGVVVLKRLADALADGDHIYAVIKGFGLNNDGAAKVGYTAPSESGQAEAIAWAQAMAGVDPRSIGYIEAHGTGTALGDPIEIAGLTRAFRAGTDAKQFCAIGSVKTAIGHLDVAAGMPGLINAALALHHRKLPPSLNFVTPNPNIDFGNSPFYVNTVLRDWKPGAAPRRAGVSAFGIGGTNAHVVLEEAPAAEASAVSQEMQLLVLSARTRSALEAASRRLAERLESCPDLDLADVAHTLQTGRREFAHRRAVVCADAAEARGALEGRSPARVFTRSCDSRAPSVVFMFPGQGAQRVNMGRDLYASESMFREQVDLCAAILEPHSGFDLRTILYPGLSSASASEREVAAADNAQRNLKQTFVTQPALFVIEYALAKWLMSRGIQPQAMIGHSIGEYVAACLAGVFSVEDALRVVAERGRLMQQMNPGAMLAVRLPESEVAPQLPAALSLATANAVNQCVVSGPFEDIDAFQQQLSAQGVGYQRLETSHAFHSAMMEPALEPFIQCLRQASLRPPRVPFVSNVSGSWITAAQATNPGYWAEHLRKTVRFASGLETLMTEPSGVFVECGPGQALSGFARQHPSKGDGHVIIPALAPIPGAPGDIVSALGAIGQMWTAGVKVDWRAMHSGARRRVRLPTYPFERKRFMIEPGVMAGASVTRNGHVDAAGDGSHGTGNGSTSEVQDGGRESTEPPAIAVEVRALFGKLSGIDLSRADGSAPFLELGFDSLMLTHASGAIEKRFGARIGFGQLLAKFSTFDLLTAHLEKCAAGGDEKSLAASASESAFPGKNGAEREDVTPWTPAANREQSTA